MQLLSLQRRERQYFYIWGVGVKVKEETSSIVVAKTERGRW